MSNKVIIEAKGTYPGSVLSNFYPHSFKVGELCCNSMEGFLQSLKFEDVGLQNICAQKVGNDAKQYGKIAPDWRKDQVLWFRGQPMLRNGAVYKSMIFTAFESLVEQCPEFKQALIDTGNAILTHPMGNKSPKETILTENEFVGILNILRTRQKTSLIGLFI